MTIRVAHDFICPWCWVGLLQAKKLTQEFGVAFEWVGYELYPDELEWPDASPAVPVPANKPTTPTRFQFLLLADGLELPEAKRPHRMRTHNAHEAVEFAKTLGRQDAVLECLYREYWERGTNINDVAVLTEILKPILPDTEGLQHAIETRQFRSEIIGFDDPAHETGVYNVPNFWIGEKSFAEQPYSVLRKAVQEFIGDDIGIYSALSFPPSPAHRPYVYVNMVTTIDGKILTGEPNEHVMDLGSKLDHTLMNRTIEASDAVLVGAQTLRASGNNWNPKVPKRIVVTKSGDVDEASRFLSGDGLGIIATTDDAQIGLTHPITVIEAGKTEVDFVGLLSTLRNEFAVEKLLVLGGSEINAQLLRLDLVDELFLTVAAKIKLGKHVPTYAGGEPLRREEVRQFELIEHHVVGDETFLRYRRR